jgi:hypothetical protein
MKKQYLPLAILSLVVIFMPYSTSASPNGSAVVTDLVASQHYDIGDVIVSNDATHLYVTYMVDIIWLRLYETHVHASTLPIEIPQKNGNPIPGQFHYLTEHDRWVQVFTYTIPLEAGWTPGTEISIAAHAVVTGVCGEFATAWGDGTGFSGKNWATYFNYTIQ